MEKYQVQQGPLDDETIQTYQNLRNENWAIPREHIYGSIQEPKLLMKL